MAKLVIGTSKQTVVPAVVRDKSPAHYIEKTVSGNGSLRNSTHIINLDNVTGVGDYVLYYAYYNNTSITGNVDFSSLTNLTGIYACQYMFNGCTGLTSVNLSSLTTINGIQSCNNMFNGCTGLTSINLSSLTTISSQNACTAMFFGCTSLTSANLSSLATISGNGACSGMFRNCTSLTSINLSSLTTISSQNACANMFSGCTSLTTLYIGGTTAINFGTRTDQFTNIFQNCTQNIDVYAPAANKTQIESFSGYPNFGGTGTVTWHWNTAE